MNAPKRFGWLKSGRFLRLLSALLAAVVLSGVLYNAVMVDRIPATYAIRVGSMSSTGAALTLTSIDVDFSEEVVHHTAESAFSTTPYVAGSFHWQSLKMIFTPSVKLPLSTKFHVHMGPGVTDLAGNSQGGTGDIDFTTVGAPKVTAATPAPGAAAVGVASTIQVTFDRLMDTQKVIAGLKVDPDFSYQASWNGPTLIIKPNKPLAYDGAYTIAIGDPAVDTDGTKLPPYSLNFTTVGVGLRVTGLIPTPNVAGVNIRSQIAVVFDSAIDPSSVANAIKLTPPVSGSTKAVALPDDTQPSAAPTPSAGAGATVLVFTPDSPLAAHTTYAVTMAATVTRTDGQVAPAQEWSFTTGESPANALNQIAFMSDRAGVNNVWIMNPDGSNQREVTWELSPVAGFDVSGDGLTIAYGAGGVVTKMSIGGDGVQTVTPTGDYEYAPVITPDASGLIVGRRDAQGADAGYWRYPLTSGSDIKQLATDGSPAIGSVALAGDGLTGQPGMPQWSGRAAFSGDGTAMLLVRGSDGVVELLDPKGIAKPQKLGIVANSRPVWAASDNAFFVSATKDEGATWSYYRVTLAGAATAVGPSTGDLDTDGRGISLLIKATEGTIHIAFVSGSGGSPTLLCTDPTLTEASPSFSPDGSTIVFSRAASQTPAISAGIWTVKPDGSGLTNLSTDGAYPRWLP